MHVYRGVQPTNYVVQQSILSAKLYRVNTKNSRNIVNSVQQTILLVDCIPNIAAVVSCIRLSVLLQVDENNIVVFRIFI